MTSMPTLTVRDATRADAEACAAIYAPYVTDTAITFEYEPPTAEQMADRIAAARERHAWIVLQDTEETVGYAYGGPFRPRDAYQWTCEVSVYLRPGRRRTGAGRTLYRALLPRLAQRGMRTAIACMTLPNDASVGLHRSLGFEDVGVMRGVGHKFGTWHDIAWARLDLSDHQGRPGTASSSEAAGTERPGVRP